MSKETTSPFEVDNLIDPIIAASLAVLNTASAEYVATTPPPDLKLPRRFERALGPMIETELRAVSPSLDGIGWSLTDGFVTVSSDVPADTVALIEAVVAAHDASTPAPVPVPASCSKLGLKRALAEIGEWEAVKAAIASNPTLQEDWELAQEIRRTDPLVQAMIALRGYSTSQVDQLLVRANALIN